MRRLLRHIDAITRQRDRSRLETAFVSALHELSGAQRTRLYRLSSLSEHTVVVLAAEQDADGLRQHDDGVCSNPALEDLHQHPALAECLEHKSATRYRPAGGRWWQEIFPIRHRNNEIVGFVVLDVGVPMDAALAATLEALIGIFDNCQDLIDYSQSDTLTGLLNRKTFDEYLFRILAQRSAHAEAQGAAVEGQQRRQAAAETDDHWLCVIDIDHFKRINDNFGHMIGDEVLLLMANRMKAHFRAQDKLFRFGGEEFVILLKPTTIQNAFCAFERFRASVELQEFPQVGRVTISGGFARFGSNETAAVVLGNADRALYWAKEHGRNQVCSFEQLVERGELSPQTDLNAEVDFF